MIFNDVLLQYHFNIIMTWKKKSLLNQCQGTLVY